ncbi:MAG: TonB family protein [Pseudomonadota bacterium]
MSTRTRASASSHPKPPAALLSAARIVFAALALGLSSMLHAQAGAMAVPEMLELTEAELGTPAGGALAAAQEAFLESLHSDTERAVQNAKQVVALATESYGSAHDYAARALTNLAIVQASDADFAAAIENFNAAIGMRETQSGRIVSANLINPLLGLANAQLAIGDLDSAIAAFERAIHVSHVTGGVNNLDQVDIIDAMSRAHFAADDRNEADDLQDTAYRLRERHFEGNDDLRLDAIEQRAMWHARLGNHLSAVRYYRRLVREMGKHHGKNDARLIEPLVALANAAVRVREGDNIWGASNSSGGRLRVGTTNTYRNYEIARLEAQMRRMRMCPGGLQSCAPRRAGTPEGVDQVSYDQAVRAMARAVRIAREHSQEDPSVLANTLVTQGDWYQSLDQSRKSRRPYRRAWVSLEDQPGLRDTLFARPVPVTSVDARSAAMDPANELGTATRYPNRGFVDVIFDVDQRGRVRNVRVLKAEPRGVLDKHVSRQLRQAPFRPRFEDGKPVRSVGLTYRYAFRFDESTLTDRERETMQTTRYDADPAAVSPLGRIDYLTLGQPRDERFIGDNLPGSHAVEHLPKSQAQ